MYREALEKEYLLLRAKECKAWKCIFYVLISKCGKVFHSFTDHYDEKSLNHPCIVNTVCYSENVAFDKVTSKVVHKNPSALKDHPIGIFFMDVY